MPGTRTEKVSGAETGRNRRPLVQEHGLDNYKHVTTDCGARHL
ncbi:hypothetical protein ACFPU1_00915 [Thalassorhabdus alkalitolerans]|uniref:Transposase n=1 Tax=Thalassorhabdus alkalitolerans TaxID=2282697 RepID=A0ABW0YMK4_9BACI